MPEDQAAQPPSWSFSAEEQQPQAIEPETTIQPVTWTASEFVAHHKNSSWYFLLTLAIVAVGGVVFLLTRDKISTAMIAIVGIGLAIFGARQPRVLNYRVDSHGLSIGKKSYGWDMFKSFAVVQEGAIDSIYLTPLQRFMPAITVYFAPEDEGKIINVIASYLPHEERKRDMIDKIMHKIRF